MDTALALFQLAVTNAPDLVGFILPPIVDYLNKDVLKEQERFIVTVLVCLAAATLLNYRQLVYGSPEAIITSGTIIFVQSQVVFNLYFKQSYLRSKLRPQLSSESEILPRITQ